MMLEAVTSLFLLTAPSPNALETLYSRQDPLSLSKQLCFYAQYPDTEEGKKAKMRIESLLHLQELNNPAFIDMSGELFNEILKSILKTSHDPIHLKPETLTFIETLAEHSGLKKQKGSLFTTFEELQKAHADEIDIGRGMLLLSFEKSPELIHKIRTYEAVLNFMALCIKARLLPDSSKQQTVEAINYFIFHELAYRFPAFSQHEAHIDTYTILPHVLDNRQGVCLGVSLLYYSLAQRLGLKLDIYTPPGHIFLSLHPGLNIETTARGIHMPLDAYLSFHIKKIAQRTPKEMLGLSLMNEASVSLRKESFAQAIELYKKALLLIPDDPQILELLGACYIMNRDLKMAHSTLIHLKALPNRSELSSDFMVEDYFMGYVTPEGLKAVYKEVDPSLHSLEEKAQVLEKVVRKSPRFRSALYQLGITYLQLHYYEKALSTLEKLYKQSPEDPALLYYLTELSLIRYDRPKVLFYQDQLKKRLTALDYKPKAAQGLFDEIESLWPAHY